MRTSHVGSMPPYSRSPAGMLEDMVGVGVDIPPYPQTRSFIEMFLEPLYNMGFLHRRGRVYFLVREAVESGRPEPAAPAEAKEVARKASQLSLSELRGPVTGPLTLASRIYAEEGPSLSATLLPLKEVVIDFLVEYVAATAKSLRDLGYTHIFVDEPMLANMVGSRRILYGYSEDEIVAMYERIFKSVKGAVAGIHVCGRIPARLVDILCRISNLHVLNHEFKDTPENLESIDRRMLEVGDKILAPGVVSSKSLRVESVDETVDLLSKILDRYSVERVDLVSGDCGFKGLGEKPTPQHVYEVALRKLWVVKEATLRLKS